MIDHRPRTRQPGLADMDAELVGGGVAEEFHRVAAFDHGAAFGDLALQFDRLHLSAVLLALQSLLRLLLVVELALDPLAGAVETADDSPGDTPTVGFAPWASLQGTRPATP